MMRVALDTNGLYTTQAGVARYIRGLIRGFQQLHPPDVQIYPLAWEVENFGYRQPQRALKTFYRECFWARVIAPRRIAQLEADLLHSTVGSLFSPPPSVKHVITLHDLASRRFPKRFRAWQRRAAQRSLDRILKADRVICISRFTADEAMQLLGLPAARIEVIYNGCDFHPDGPIPPEQPPEVTLPAEYFLFVGSLEPGKNLALLKGAYDMAASQSPALPPLVIVGARWEGVATEGTPPENWIYLGRQPDAVLVYLYRRALALVFPSKYEGFGLPVAEAMALGCPVICSPVASLPEVGGTAAHFVELSPAAYVAAMHRMSRDLVWRDELIAKGRVQARKFSWLQCAAQTVETYRHTLASG
jgi:glycosyltransferase involved in cell wall biosynthesis